MNIKRKKKSLIGWAYKDWVLSTTQGYVNDRRVDTPYIRLKLNKTFGEQVKVRITIKEI